MKEEQACDMKDQSPSQIVLKDYIQRIGEMLVERKELLTTAESCTGGMISAAVTDISGSSAWFDRAFITYSNEAKQQMLGVKVETLQQYGAVSIETVVEMCKGALHHSNASWAIAVSGIAGPTGGTPEKPVGTVCIGWANKNGYCEYVTEHFSGDRAQVRQQTVVKALQQLALLIVNDKK